MRDSGADIRLCPHMLRKERDNGQVRAVLKDAQGGRLQAYGHRLARVQCTGSEENLVVLEDDFIAPSVPVYFRKNSLAIKANVRAAGMVGEPHINLHRCIVEVEEPEDLEEEKGEDEEILVI
eukprot:s119_g33.t1